MGVATIHALSNIDIESHHLIKGTIAINTNLSAFALEFIAMIN